LQLTPSAVQVAALAGAAPTAMSDPHITALNKNADRRRFINKSYFIPIQRPSLLRRPDLVSGMPVAREILRLAFVTPNARFHEKVSPGPSFMPQTYTQFSI
jgi:hypothetical protein